MLIPYSTDSPIYHWPFATIGLIVINIMAFTFQMAIPDKTDGLDLMADFGGIPGWIDLALSRGDGLHPIQWITSFFLHGNTLHLVGNMIFLWAFGLIVEGKIGPFLFAMLYMGVGIFQNAVQQVLYLPYAAGPSVGASGAIYGIMMVALLWAPQDNLKCLLGIWYYFWLVDIPIAMFGLVYFLWDFSFALLGNFSMGTSLLHVMGALTGLVPGLVFLLMHWVDCEQRDLISMFRELFGQKPLKIPKSKKEVEQEQHDVDMARANRKNTIDRSWQSMDTHLNAGNVKAAMEMFRQMRKLDAKIQWNESMLLRIISLLQQQEDWDKVETYSNEYLNNFQTKANEIRLNLVRLLLIHKSSPRKAIKAIKQFDLSTLSEKQVQVVKQIVRKSQEMIDDGVIELGED